MQTLGLVNISKCPIQNTGDVEGLGLGSSFLIGPFLGLGFRLLHFGFRFRVWVFRV